MIGIENLHKYTYPPRKSQTESGKKSENVTPIFSAATSDQKYDLLVRQYSTGTLGYYVCADQSKWTELGNGVGMEWTVIA